MLYTCIGVTTIAGGYTQKTGLKDGPAQNATFSADLELDFVAEGCVLLVSDRGNQLVRQINLKAEDCSGGSSSGGGELFLCLFSVMVLKTLLI